MEENRLQDIPQFRTLEQNLELRVALQQVDKLKSENVSLQQRVDTLEDILFIADNDYLDHSQYPSMEKEINMNELNEQSVQAEIEEAREKDEFFTVGDDGCLDFGPPTYEDVVDPEFDRGFKMGQDWLIQDIIQYLKNIRKNGEA